MNSVRLLFLVVAVANGADFENSRIRISVAGSEVALWTLQLKSTKRAVPIAPPVFSVGGQHRAAVLTRVRESAPPRTLANGAIERRYEGQFRDDPSLSLEVRFRTGADSPVVRFAYSLRSTSERRLTKSGAKDDLVYVRALLQPFSNVLQVRVSEFLEQVHSYSLQEYPIAARDFDDRAAVMGPLLAASDGHQSLLLAYEHGSQVPDAFLQYQLTPGRTVQLAAEKANYLTGQVVAPGRDFETIWFEAALVDGGVDALKSAYRDFVLHEMALNNESRKPYIFYNTWNFQERNKHWYHHAYLDSMNEVRMLEEIEVAHRMGIEVFVLDTGWYDKTGDWRVSSARFPHGLAPLKTRLDSYGMKLGLWFDPTAAAVSSSAFRSHARDVMSRHGKVAKPEAIWETEPSHRMCLVSGWADAFADELIRAYRELGVTYFKWDAVDQYGCDSPEHAHGDRSHSEEERAQSYAFQLPRQMARIVEKLTAACPNAIVDFDITEAGRAVGLSFLSAGKYFLINNGPYYQNYDVPIDPDKDNWNLFFYKGPARTWICRTPLNYDSWIPSILFLTHYFPDDPEKSQVVNIASLVLGQNGIWGDLPRISEHGFALFSTLLGYYKQVRDDVTASVPVVSGPVSGASEIHEKIATKSGRGLVALFSTAKGQISYVTAGRPDRNYKTTDGVTVEFDDEGRGILRADFREPGAALVFFGAK